MRLGALKQLLPFETPVASNNDQQTLKLSHCPAEVSTMSFNEIELN